MIGFDMVSQAYPFPRSGQLASEANAGKIKKTNGKDNGHDRRTLDRRVAFEYHQY